MPGPVAAHDQSWRRQALRALVLALLLVDWGGASAASLDLNADTLQLRTATKNEAQRMRPPLLSRAQLLAPPVISDVQLSPSGHALVYVQQSAGRRSLWRLQIDSGERQRLLAEAEDVDVHWSGDGSRLWLADGLGLSVLDAEAVDSRRLLKWDVARGQRFWGVDPRALDFALIRERIESGADPIYRYLRIDTGGRTTELLSASQPLQALLLDGAGEVRFSAAYAGSNYDTVIRRHDLDGVHELLRCRGAETCALMDYREDGARLLMRAHRGQDRLALQQWRADSGQWEVLHQDLAGVGELEQVLWPRTFKEWAGIAYADAQVRWQGRTPELAARFKSLQTQLPGANLSIETSADGRVWRVRAWQSTWPQDRYFLFHPDSGQLTELLTEETSIAAGAAPDQLARAQPLRYRASDGRTLHGYVFLPPGVDPAKAPLIALIHGGPYSRDRDDYDPIAQLLANRGAAVFKPNFRGSTGFGLDYRRAAGDDFGRGRVLADIIEGLDALLAAGIGDPQRQAVAGHSFGGYASLLAATHHVRRFRFALASAAPVDFGWGMRYIADNGGSALPADGPPRPMRLAQYGLPVLDPSWRERMRTEAPLTLIDQLAVPVFLWAGARDDRVPLASLARYAAEVAASGKAMTFLVDPTAGHAPDDTAGMQALLYLYELAMSRELGLNIEPPLNSLQNHLQRHLKLDTNAATHGELPGR